MFAGIPDVYAKLKRLAILTLITSIAKTGMGLWLELLNFKYRVTSKAVIFFKIVTLKSLLPTSGIFLSSVCVCMCVCV